MENMKKSWESVRGEQDQLEVQDTKEMLQLQDSVKTKICQVESILDLTSRFHHTARQVSSAGFPSNQFRPGHFTFCCFNGEMKGFRKHQAALEQNLLLIMKPSE